MGEISHHWESLFCHIYHSGCEESASKGGFGPQRLCFGGGRRGRQQKAWLSEEERRRNQRCCEEQQEDQHRSHEKRDRIEAKRTLVDNLRCATADHLRRVAVARKLIGRADQNATAQVNASLFHDNLGFRRSLAAARCAALRAAVFATVNKKYFNINFY